MFMIWGCLILQPPLRHHNPPCRPTIQRQLLNVFLRNLHERLPPPNKFVQSKNRGYGSTQIGYGTTPVGCRDGSRYCEGCWGFPYLKKLKYLMNCHFYWFISRLVYFHFIFIYQFVLLCILYRLSDFLFCVSFFTSKMLVRGCSHFSRFQIFRFTRLLLSENASINSCIF